MSSDSEDQIEHDAIKNFARALGFYAQIHRNFDPLLAAPGRENACWYLQRSKKQNPNVAPHEPTILKFALASEIYDWLNEWKRTESSND